MNKTQAFKAFGFVMSCLFLIMAYLHIPSKVVDEIKDGYLIFMNDDGGIDLF